MSQEIFAGIVGVLISLVITYVPVVGEWYYALSEAWKRGVLLLAGLLVALAMFGLSCVNWYNIVACDATGVKEMVEIFVAFLLGNQGAYMLTTESKVKARLDQEELKTLPL